MQTADFFSVRRKSVLLYVRRPECVVPIRTSQEIQIDYSNVLLMTCIILSSHIPDILLIIFDIPGILIKTLVSQLSYLEKQLMPNLLLRFLLLGIATELQVSYWVLHKCKIMQWFNFVVNGNPWKSIPLNLISFITYCSIIHALHGFERRIWFCFNSV